MEKKRSLGLSIRYCNQEGNAPGGEGLWGNHWEMHLSQPLCGCLYSRCGIGTMEGYSSECTL